MFGEKVGFMDLSHFRFGWIKDIRHDKSRNEFEITYVQPQPGISRTVTIRNIPPNAIIHDIPIYADLPFARNVALINGEHGKSPFYSKYLDSDGLAIQLINSMKKKEDYDRISEGAERASQRIHSLGARTTLKDVTDNMKMVEEATKKDIPFFGRKGVRSF